MTFGEWLAATFGAIPSPQLAVFLLAMSPVGEVRMSIPVGILAFGMDWAEAFTFSLLGNLMVVPLLTVMLPWLERGLRKWSVTDRWVDKVFERTRNKADAKVQRYREYAVFLFIATPIPGTGAWTGVLVAYLFGLRFKDTVRYYYAGIVASCVIATALVQLGLLAL